MIATNTFAPTPIIATSPVTSTKSATKRRRKGVSFYPKVTVKYCRHHNDYTPEERTSTWLSGQELHAMRADCHKIAREFSKPSAAGKTVSSNGVDILRGLEGKTAQGVTKRKRVKAIARDVVFYEQNFQIQRGFCDANAIADVYYEQTETAQIEAHMKALRDQVDALVVPPAPSKSTKKGLVKITSPTNVATCRPKFLSSTSSRRLLTDKFFHF